MVKKTLTAVLIIGAIIFFGYHTLHYGNAITRKDNAALYQWRLNWADRR